MPTPLGYLTKGLSLDEMYEMFKGCGNIRCDETYLLFQYEGISNM